jgi:transposase
MVLMPSIPITTGRRLGRGFSEDPEGLCLFSKRLEKGRFEWPSAEGREVITPAQLAMLLKGIDWRMPRRTWRAHPTTAP